MHRRAESLEPHNRPAQNQSPDTEDRLDLTEEVKHLPCKTHFVGMPVIVAVFFRATDFHPCAVPFLHEMAPVFDLRRDKGVKHREDKNQRRYHVERFCRGAGHDLSPDAVVRGHRITREIFRKRRSAARRSSCIHRTESNQTKTKHDEKTNHGNKELSSLRL